MQSITKTCADTLRVFTENHNIKLKASHAHELVAAFFGYKSKAAMQADTFCSVEGMKKAHILVLMPSSFIDQRRQCLEDLPPELPDTYTLGEKLFTDLIAGGEFSGRSFASFSHLAEVLTNEYLQKHGDLMLPANFGLHEKARYIFSKPLYEFNPKIEATDNGLKLMVANRYYGSADVNFQPIDVTITIRFKRVAGHVGYILSDISGDVTEAISTAA